MTTDAESNVMTLKEQLEQGRYDVDAKKVADAIVRNPLWLLLFASSDRHPGRLTPCSGLSLPGRVAGWQPPVP